MKSLYRPQLMRSLRMMPAMQIQSRAFAMKRYTFEQKDYEPTVTQVSFLIFDNLELVLLLIRFLCTPMDQTPRNSLTIFQLLRLLETLLDAWELTSSDLVIQFNIYKLIDATSLLQLFVDGADLDSKRLLEVIEFKADELLTDQYVLK